MSILLDEAQEAIGREARRVLDARYDRARLLALLDRPGGFDETFWTTATEQGWTAIGIPEEQGGIGLGLVEMGLVAGAAGAVTAGAPFLTTNAGCAYVLQSTGSADLAQTWLPRLAEGSAIGCCAFAEGNEPIAPHAETRFVQGKLTGTKKAVPAGLRADFAIVLARADDREALVLCELGSADRHPVESFDNTRLHADLVFRNAPAILLAEGEAARVFALEALGRMALVAANEQVGGAEALLFVARDYANSRKAFGQPIGAFQSIKHRIAELYGLVEVAKANCLHAASREGQGDFLEAVACARLSATEAYDTAARDCIQIHGGIGVTWESGLHLHMRRARSLAIEQGNTLFWEDLLTDLLAESAIG